MDNILVVSIFSPVDVLNKTAATFKQKRLLLKLTQQGLAKRSGVSLGSIKRFEQTGDISYRSLLRLALVLDCLTSFEKIGERSPDDYFTMKDLEAEMQIPRRGSLS